MGDNSYILREIADLFGQLQECFNTLAIDAESAEEEAEENEEVEKGEDFDEWNEDDDL